MTTIRLEVFPSFEPLNGVSNLKFLANENAVRHIGAMEFDKDKITFVD